MQDWSIPMDTFSVMAQKSRVGSILQNGVSTDAHSAGNPPVRERAGQLSTADQPGRCPTHEKGCSIMTRDYVFLALAPALVRLVLYSVALLRCERKDVPSILRRWRRL